MANSIEGRSKAQDAVLRRINDEFDCWLYVELTACPVQLFGNIDGMSIDFYARSSHWYLQIGAGERPLFSRAGKTEGDHSASWLEPDAMEAILRTCLTEYGDSPLSAYIKAAPVDIVESED